MMKIYAILIDPATIDIPITIGRIFLIIKLNTFINIFYLKYDDNQKNLIDIKIKDVLSLTSSVYK